MWQTYKRKTYKKSHFIQDVYDLHVIWKKLKHKISKDCKTIFFSKENVAQLSQTPSSNQVEADLSLFSSFLQLPHCVRMSKIAIH